MPRFTPKAGVASVTELSWTANKVLLGAGTGTSPTEIALGTLSATCVVIANDAKSEIKVWGGILQDAGHPVWVCGGASDDEDIQDAIDALPT